ncbi:MAG TPA: hypothetical protein VFG23_28130 [Polyangia bacterium]|nr:hypothetical protein [Polyangia bacterium]
MRGLSSRRGLGRGRLVVGVIACAALGVVAVALAAAPPTGTPRGGALPAGAPPLPIDVAAPPADKTPSPTVRIVITVLPSTKKAMVFWGKKRLGVIAQHAPLILQRPRDSGPLDLVVKSEGCLPVQTRAYTFGDSKFAVKLTPVEEKNTLLGYREELPPPDAGVPPAEPDAAMP